MILSPSCRWLLVGTYVGFATVGAFASWYMYTSFMGIDLSQDGHSTVTWHQLSHWNQCSEWKGFQVGFIDHQPTFHPCDQNDQNVDSPWAN